MKEIIHAYILRNDSGYRVECADLPVNAESPSLDGAIRALEQAVRDYLKGKDLAALGLRAEPKIMVSFQLGLYAFDDM